MKEQALNTPEAHDQGRGRERMRGFRGMTKEEVFRSVDSHMLRSRKAQWFLK